MAMLYADVINPVNYKSLSQLESSWSQNRGAKRRLRESGKTVLASESSNLGLMFGSSWGCVIRRRRRRSDSDAIRWARARNLRPNGTRKGLRNCTLVRCKVGKIWIQRASICPCSERPIPSNFLVTFVLSASRRTPKHT